MGGPPECIAMGQKVHYSHFGQSKAQSMSEDQHRELNILNVLVVAKEVPSPSDLKTEIPRIPDIYRPC